ncbi:hypothetical protein [Sphingomonas bacterium]|uniref:hypothetical protein n=1 Tax=Sphingomonas bacterium TaxID=1895847 RepID=UPI001576889C|nr:hypothetical protein [Sphingomonas bacterium]
MPWDADPQVSSPFGRPIAELLEPRARRQQLDGFEPLYSDIVDYILRCTHRIWEEKNIGLCRTHYAEDCPVFTLGGFSAGVDAVIDNTVAAIAGSPDRSPIAEDVIWSEDTPGTFLSSHRIVSFATHLGHDAIGGAASGAHTGVRVIADCLCRENLIVDEWLVRDNLQLARMLGVDPLALARRQAAADREGDPARHGWLAAERARVRDTPSIEPPGDHPAAPIAAALDRAFNHDLYGEAAAIVWPAIEALWPSGRRTYGPAGWIGLLLQLRAPLRDPCFRLEHYAARPLPDGDIAVALRWSLAGRHGGIGVWGLPGARELLILAISHYRLRAGHIVEDITVFDELAVLRQIEGGLGA